MGGGLGIWIVATQVCWDYQFGRSDLYSAQSFGSSATMNIPEGQESFRILQIADTQVGELDENCEDIYYEPCGVSNTTDFIRRLIKQTKPSLIVFTGDQVQKPSEPEAALDAVLSPAIEAKIPFVFLFGNHDIEPCGKWNYAEMHAYVADIALLTGTSVITVTSNASPPMRLWFFDYVYDDSEGYTAVPERHVAWFEDVAAEMPQTQSLAFVHVPLLEFKKITPRTGEKFENLTCSKQNFGLYDAMLRNGVVAVAAGHEHINDYCGATAENMQFCYAGGVGFTTYGRFGWPRRARVFEYTLNGDIQTYKVLNAVEGRPLPIIDREYLARGGA